MPRRAFPELQDRLEFGLRQVHLERHPWDRELLPMELAHFLDFRVHQRPE